LLLTKSVIIKWCRKNRDWYKSKGYRYTKMNDEFEVRVEDLQGHIFVTVQCDGCGKITNIQNKIYKKHVSQDGTYNCNSFYDWCYNNLIKDVADIIIKRWDYELNIDKDGNKLTPKDISHASSGLSGKGYWFKCLDHPEHESELKSIANLTNGPYRYLNCKQCSDKYKFIAITHPHLMKYLVNPEDGYLYSMGQNKNILVKCPDCSREKEMVVNNFIKNGVICICGDGIPYTEKFTFNFLEQLKLNFNTQLTKTKLKWCKNYRYDNYINKINCIIETHGLQHYEDIFGNWNISLEEIQENDFDKEWLARSNNIRNYIIIDCRYSTMEWIKNSIMNSKLSALLNFKAEDIDWLKCHEFALSNLVKKSCDLWNDGIKILEIGTMLNIHPRSITRYLHQGDELNWCDYKQEAELKNRRIQVICLNTKEKFNSIADASKKYNVTDSGISKCCLGKQKTTRNYETKEEFLWMYYDEYMIKSQVIGWYEKYIKDNEKYTKEYNTYNKVSAKVICLTTDKIFDSISDGAREYKLNVSSISRCCNNEYKSAGKHPITGEKMVWMFYDEYIKI